MNRVILVITFVGLLTKLSPLICQDDIFSKQYDLSFSGTLGGFPIDFTIHENQMIFYSYATCYSSSNCISIIELMNNGSLVRRHIIDSLALGNDSPIVTIMDTDLVSLSTSHSNSSHSILKYDVLDHTHSVISSNKTVTDIVNFGLIRADTNLYSYGSIYDTILLKFNTYICKWSLISLEELNCNIYNPQIGNSLFDLNVENYNQSCFISRGPGKGGLSNYYINTLTDLTEINNIFTFMEFESVYPSLKVDSDRFAFFSSISDPLDLLADGKGRLNKLDISTGQLAWSSELNSGNLDNRMYRVNDILLLNDNSVLLCGEVIRTANETLVTTGFIAKVSTSDGHILWLHDYIIPTGEGEIPYNNSELLKVKLHENGNIVSMGSTYDPNEDFKLALWVLSVDSIGCLNSSNCDDLVIASNVNTENIKLRNVIYPNPTNNNIYLDDFYNCNYTILDLNSRVVDEGIVKDYISVGHLGQGHYAMILQCDEDLDIVTSKFIIVH